MGGVLQRAYGRMGQEAANAGVGRAPVNRGHLKASMMLQHGDIAYKGAGIHMVALWKPSEKSRGKSGPGPLEYGAELDSPRGGSETVTIPAGPRTYPGKGRLRGGKSHGRLFGRHAGTWSWSAVTVTRKRSSDPRYAGTPRQGKPTRGWFYPGVVDDLHRANVPDKVARLAAKELEAGWNGR